MKVYGIIGRSEQVVVMGGRKPSHMSEHIEMKSERPSEDYVAAEDGTWVLNDSARLDREIGQLEKALPLWLEKHIEFDHGGKTNDPGLQEIYDLKKGKKEEKKSL